MNRLLLKLCILSLLSIGLIALATSGSADDHGEPVELTGYHHIIWAHPDPSLGEDFPTIPEHILSIPESGERFALDGILELTRDAGGPHKFRGHQVHITGLLDREMNRIQLDSIRLEPTFPPIGSHVFGTHVHGSQPWVTILCRFADSVGPAPEAPGYFEDLMDFMNDYWLEVSYGEIDILGSYVTEVWYDLPLDRQDYMDDPTTHFDGHELNWGKLADDCIGQADAEVHYPDFEGINMIFDQPLDGFSWGGGDTLNLDGEVKTYAMTWMAAFHWRTQGVLGHEMGHGFGLPHSSGPFDATYDSRWDVMSGRGECRFEHADFGCIAAHTIAIHKDALGWIPGSAVYEATTDPDQLIFLERLAQPTPLGPNEYLLATISIGGSDEEYYTVESRKFVGYDVEVPGEAVVIHKMDTTLDDRNAQVVVAPGGTSPNGAAARWTPGELFEDQANNISVAVLEETETGFWVLINPTPADLSITKSAAPDPAVAGLPLAYTVEVTNHGPNDAHDVTVVDTLPAEVSYISDTGGCAEASGVLTCTFGTLADGASTSFEIVVDVPADLVFTGTTSITNVAEVFEDHPTGFDPDTSNNVSTLVTDVIAVADVEILDFTASDTPPQVLIGDSFDLTLTKTIVNNGPSTPVDVDVTVSTVTDAGLLVEPPGFGQFVPALTDVEREVIEEFTVTCTGPGNLSAQFNNEIEALDAIDPDLTNNTAAVTIEVECVIPVQINIRPGSDPVPVNLRSNGVIPVAVLTTDEGEYGLPMAIDATQIDPTTVLFGRHENLLNADPPVGAPAFQGRGHIEDSFEMDQVTKDGDLDMVIRFRTQETLFISTDTQGCMTGQILIEGNWYTFFGCDDIVFRP